MSNYVLHPRLAADTIPVGDLPLCRVLLMNDANYPWVILVPRVADAREAHELPDADRRALWDESAGVARALMREFAGHKLNVAALGNVVAQLHVHHVVRFTTDAAWPAPVWGQAPARPYDEPARLERVRRLAAALAALPGFRPAAPR